MKLILYLPLFHLSIYLSVCYSLTIFYWAILLSNSLSTTQQICLSSKPSLNLLHYKNKTFYWNVFVYVCLGFPKSTSLIPFFWRMINRNLINKCPSPPHLNSVVTVFCIEHFSCLSICSWKQAYLDACRREGGEQGGSCVCVCLSVSCLLKVMVVGAL